MKLRVANSGGHHCVVRVEGSSTVQDLRVAIEATSGVPAETQRLFFGERELVGGRPLSELLSDYTDEEVLLLTHRSEEQIGWLREVDALTTTADVDSWLRLAPPEAKQDRDVILAAVCKYGL